MALLASCPAFLNASCPPKCVAPSGVICHSVLQAFPDQEVGNQGDDPDPQCSNAGACICSAHNPRKVLRACACQDYSNHESRLGRAPAEDALPLRLLLRSQEQGRLRAQRGLRDSRQVQQRLYRRALHPRVVFARLLAHQLSHPTV